MRDPRKVVYLDEAIRIVSGYNGTPMIVEQLKQLPSAEQKTCEYWDDESNYCALNRPTAEPERKTGKWLEKEVIHADEAKEAIEEWQSCKCSVCGRYDTRPYMYYFSEPHYCSWCGALNGEIKEGELYGKEE